MNFKQELGKRGEKAAKEYLIEKGYSILETNFLCVFGEVDIIARKENELIFVEVKTRGQELFGRPREGVTYVKKKHIYKVAEFYLYKNKIVNTPISLDVIEVYIFDEDIPKVLHIKNAIIEKPQICRRYSY